MDLLLRGLKAAFVPKRFAGKDVSVVGERNEMSTAFIGAGAVPCRIRILIIIFPWFLNGLLG